MLHFHYCKLYLNAVSSQLREVVAKTLDEYSNRESLKGGGKLSAFTGGIYVLLIKRLSSEIIIQEKKIFIGDKEETVYFVRALKNGLSDYIEIRDGKWLAYNPLPENEVTEFIAKFKETRDFKGYRQEPPHELLQWQTTYKLKVEYDIYETESWVNFSHNNSLNDGMKNDEAKLFRLTLLEIFNSQSEPLQRRLLSDSLTNFKTYSIELNQVGVIYTQITINDKNIYLLQNGANTKTQASHWNEIMKIDYSYGYKSLSIEDISSIALKAYPSWALNDADLWVKIEKNNEMGNLSLLPEQTTFLKNFKFPKYINGQAGSGKSTMLYYLFANAYYYKYAGEITGDIIFITENKNLLEYTKKSVYDLLLFNPEFDLSSEDIAIVNMEKHFSPFKEFLLNMLPQDNTAFKHEKYLDFSKFNTLYEQSNIPNYIKNRYSSELIWFVITTYIYGYDLSYQITSDNYTEKMPKEGKEIISKEDLQSIEKNIIRPFYEKLISTDEYWDKIKLIKFLNKNITDPKQYEIIFCDEAQDFSRVELNFILKLSAYAQYDLSNVSQFPVVFAGDALQTVNPTGFKAEVLTSMIYNELTDIGYKIDAGTLEFTPVYNYRSSQTIVNIANAIQYYRKTKLGATIKNPQKSKRPVLFENEHLNVFITIDTLNIDSTLQKKIEFKTIIVPVNRDQIENYKNTHTVLNQYNNIISSVDAKGIDFNEVAIYGFGELQAQQNLGEYETRFFFNKLYVAVTRAQAELVIIDSESSKEVFWKPLIENYLSSNWNNSIPALNKFEDIIIFDAKEVIQSSSTIVERDAQRQREQGILEQNTPLLQIASSHFIKIGRIKEYYLCLGEIEEIKQNWEKAAEYFLKKDVGEEGIEKAAIAFWNGKHWNELLNISGNLKNERQQVRTIIAKLFINNNLQNNDLKILNSKYEIINKVLNKTSWRDEVIEKFKHLLLSKTDDDDIRQLTEIAENICYNSDVAMWRVLGECYFRLKRYEASISSFERIGETGELFLKAKLEIAKHNNNIEEVIIWLGRLFIEVDNSPNEFAYEIINYYSNNKQFFAKPGKNIYVQMYIYFAHMIQEIKDNELLLELAKTTEGLFENRNLELAEGYLLLLKKYNIHSDVLDFILERWVKKSIEGGIMLSTFNQEYEALASEKNLTFTAFMKDEVAKIPKIPTTLFNDFSDHIRNIRIQNFRQFKDIKIEDIGLFNLIVGDNNIGKTSLLEAFLFTPIKKDYLERLSFAHIARTNIHPDKDKSDSSVNTFLYFNLNQDFVFNFVNCEDVQKNIIFTFYTKRNTWNYELIFDQSKNYDSHAKSLLFDIDDYKNLMRMPYLNGIKQPFMPYGKGFSNDLAQIYDSEIRPNRNMDNAFIENMMLFIPQINQIYASLDGSIEIRDKSFPEDRPLHQYGEGANKLFRILLLLTLHKGKRLLIDEIDAGIHYSKFRDFWKLILKIAQKDGTQVFATTHNEECIRYFAEVLNELGEEYQKESRVIQMKMVKSIKIRSYGFESFNLAIEDGIEIRGGTK